MKELFFACAVLLFAACATSHKMTTSVAKTEHDSVTTIRQDSISVSVSAKDSIVSQTVSERTNKTVAGDSINESETIVERIVEVADSIGNKTTTTDRTVTRTKKEWSYLSEAEYRRMQEEEIKVMLSALNSVAESRVFSASTHKATADSVYQNKSVEHKSAVSFWQKIKTSVFSLLAGAILAIVVFYYIKNK